MFMYMAGKYVDLTRYAPTCSYKPWVGGGGGGGGRVEIVILMLLYALLNTTFYIDITVLRKFSWICCK